jgi:hypothetical protein
MSEVGSPSPRRRIRNPTVAESPLAPPITGSSTPNPIWSPSAIVPVSGTIIPHGAVIPSHSSSDFIENLTADGFVLINAHF